MGFSCRSSLADVWRWGGWRSGDWPSGTVLVGVVGCFKSECQCFKTLAANVLDVTWRSA